MSWSSCNPAVADIAGEGLETEIDDGRSDALKSEVETCVITSMLSPARPLL